MIKRIFRRNMREPLSCVAVILFAAIMTLILCYLHISMLQQQKSLAETYRSVPVTFKITDLDGSSLQSAGINGWALEAFYENSSFQPSLHSYLSDLQLRMTCRAKTTNCYAKDMTSEEFKHIEDINVVGITSTKVAQELTPGYGGIITWLGSAQESILLTEELVCIVPLNYFPEGNAEIIFSYIGDDGLTREHTCKLTVIGVHTVSSNKSVYIPYATLEAIFRKIGMPRTLERLEGTLNNNDALAAFCEDAACWFAEPNPTGDPTYWGKFGYENYQYAIDIQDYLLRNLKTEMDRNLRLNRIATSVIFVLCACAGFLTGFLVIRSRKRAISLMRTLGTPQWSIFLEMELEQVLCILIGLAIGGSYSRWEPLGELGLLGLIYVLGLTLALGIFMRISLLSAIKEDE